MTLTRTYSETSTITKARVRRVMDKVHEDFQAFAVRGLISHTAIASWIDALVDMQNAGCISSFELQVWDGQRAVAGIRYSIRDDGSLLGDDPTGRLDLWGLPRDASLQLVVIRRSSLTTAQESLFIRHGFIHRAEALSLPGNNDKTYSYHGYAVERTRMGDL